MELGRRVTSRSGWAEDRRRTRLILLQQAGYTWVQIRDRLGCNDTRFGQERLAGLFGRHAGQGEHLAVDRALEHGGRGRGSPPEAGDGPFPERHGAH
jgi:hypothetical protein